ncbi:MAG TPA: Rieske 2Fe-2S domain-containing protein [Acidimicrobiales bacterium]|nr:Rieske 2Fe-2S domain-containing protein [Acidimicrobiales bacterium]
MAAPARPYPSRRPRPRPATGGRSLSWPLWTSGWALLPLRLFLGVTFGFAGLQKLADPRFLRAGAPGSVQAQLRAAAHTSPIGGQLGGLASHALAVGIAIALAEVAVGLGALAGLWTRAAAAGGLALSLGFLLTVSWHSHPYYLGPDIVFAAAWVPLVLAGAGEDPRLSLDGLLRRRAEQELGLPTTATVPMAFARVQALCGGYEAGHCHYRRGAACRPDACPVLAAPPVADPEAGEMLDRRAFLRRAQVVGLFAAAGLGTAAATAWIGRLLGGAGEGGSATSLASPGAGGSGGRAATTTPPTGPPTAGGTAGVAIGPASAVPVGGVASFTDPQAGDPAYVVQPSAGRYAAFSAVCPHAGCEVQYQSGDGEFVCPCHGARFDRTGSVLQGPATRSLSPITVAKGRDGQLYVDG